ncbi:MAG: urea transport system substrate-binding protein [Solirubrobacteraceae bacterium]|jgi:urea transport system substrate-binding protein|nr:urea transport system substrate-binding protein [Solirubrobacteraceae bacterium]
MNRPIRGQRRAVQWGLAGMAVATALFAVGCGSSSSDKSASPGSSASSSGSTIPVGILHSLSGTMAISEVSVRDSELLAIDEINKAGGVLGKQIKPVIEDGASDWPTFAEKAQKLISTDHVAATFGGWTSASRKAMLPVFERNKSLLYYPVQYEGLEASPYIFYTGATTNQQIIPGLEYLKNKLHVKTLFLVGSDYVFPRTANKEIKAWAKANGMTIVGEEYSPLGNTDYATTVNKIKQANPDAVFQTINGDSNVAFWKQFHDSGLDAKSMPVISVSTAEDEVRGVGIKNIVGQYVAWNYYQTTPGAKNAAFVKAYKARYGADRVTDDPIEAGYVGVHLWAMAVEKAGSTDPEKVKAASKGLTYDAPEGTVTIDGANQHISKTARIGQLQPDGLINEVGGSGKPITPDPFLKTYSWAKGL